MSNCARTGICRPGPQHRAGAVETARCRTADRRADQRQGPLQAGIARRWRAGTRKHAERESGRDHSKTKEAK